MAHYNVGEDEDITENATITLSKEKAEVGDTSFTVTASYGNAQPIEKVVNVTVSALDRSIKTAYEAGLALEPGKSTSDAYTFRGTCTAITGNSFFLQDDGYGMYVYNKATENLEVGKLVEVTSTIQNYSGLVETKSISSSKVIGNGTLPAAIEITGLNSFERQNILANAKSATFVSKDADWSSSKASLAVFNIGGDDITIKFDKYGFEAEKGALLNGAKEGDVFDLSNIETSFNNTKQLLFCGTSSIVKTGSAPAKEIASIVSITGPEEIALNATISPSEVTVVVAYTDQTQGNAEVKTVTVDSSTAGQKSADVTIEGWDETLHFTVLVKDEAAPTPQHAGTEADPYTVSDAKILFNDLDDGENTAECYVTGTIVADPAPSISGTRYRFYLSDGVSTTNLYAYNVDPLSGTTAHLANIPYGSVVVAKGAIKNFGGTFELCYVKDVASCILTSVERPELSSVVISGTASQTEYAVGADYNHNGLVATANFASGAAIDVSDLASWSIDPATASEGDTSISITASYDNVNSAAFNVSVTVTGTGPVTPTYYDATMAGKDNASTVTVNGNSAIKCGASSKAGSMTVTVPSGATKLRIYIGGWNNDTGRTINVTLSGNATISPTSFNVVNESVFSGTATSFTVADESIHLYEFTLSGVTEETTITFTANAASKNRFIAWGAQYAK